MLYIRIINKCLFFIDFTCQTGTTVKLLEVTIRVYHDDARFEVVEDRVYQFNCSTDMLLPRIQELSQTFK